MAAIERRDFGSRISHEKAQYPDESLTRSQLQPGNNITFTYLPNHDIVINASGVAGAGATGLDILHGTVVLADVLNAAGRVQSNTGSPEDSTRVPTLTYPLFGTPVFADINHNWNLDDKDNFLITFKYERVYSAGQTSLDGAMVVKAIPRAVGLDKNTIRIWLTHTFELRARDGSNNPVWAANDNTQTGLAYFIENKIPTFEYTVARGDS